MRSYVVIVVLLYRAFNTNNFATSAYVNPWLLDPVVSRCVNQSFSEALLIFQSQDAPPRTGLACQLLPFLRSVDSSYFTWLFSCTQISARTVQAPLSPEVQRVLPLSVLPYRLALDNKLIAVVAQSSAMVPTRDAFVAFAGSLYAPLNFSDINGVSVPGFEAFGIPGLAPYLTTQFANEYELDTYIKQAAYGVDGSVPTIFAAIVFASGGPTWDYTIRMNGTAEVRDEGVQFNVI